MTTLLDLETALTNVALLYGYTVETRGKIIAAVTDEAPTEMNLSTLAKDLARELGIKAGPKS